MKSLAMVPRVKMPDATSTGRLIGRMIRKKAVTRLAPSIEGRLFDLPRQVLEVGRQHPHAEGQGHRRIDQEERQEVVVQPERDHHLIQRDEEDRLRDDVGGEDRAPPPPEAGWTQPAEGVGRGDTQPERGHAPSRRRRRGCSRARSERIRTSKHGRPRSPEPPPSRSNSSSKFSRVGFTTMNGFPKTSSVGGLQRLHEHEVDREDAVDRGEQQKRSHGRASSTRAAGSRRPPPRAGRTAGTAR